MKALGLAALLAIQSACSFFFGSQQRKFLCASQQAGSVVDVAANSGTVNDDADTRSAMWTWLIKSFGMTFDTLSVHKIRTLLDSDSGSPVIPPLAILIENCLIKVVLAAEGIVRDTLALAVLLGLLAIVVLAPILFDRYRGHFFCAIGHTGLIRISRGKAVDAYGHGIIGTHRLFEQALGLALLLLPGIATCVLRRPSDQDDDGDETDATEGFGARFWFTHK